MKRNVGSLSLNEKNMKEKFNKAVRSSVELVSVQNVRMFAGCCRQYMMTYQNTANNNQQNMTFDMIKKYTRKIKTHCNVRDMEKAFIAKAWCKAIGVLNDCR